MVHFYRRWSFFSGIILGVILAISIKKITRKLDSKNLEIVTKKYEKWFGKQGFKRHQTSWNTLDRNYFFESQFLFRKIRIFCIIFIKKEENLNSSIATWARGCNKVNAIILPNKKSPMPVMKISKEDASWTKLCDTLKNVELKTIDWIFVANEYTFAILENFRYYIATLDPEKPYYLGHPVKFWSTIYNTKNSAYALNKKAVEMFRRHVENTGCFAENAYLNKEDFYLGRTLASLNITPIDSTDEDGFSLFYPYTWDQVLFPSEGFQSTLYPVICCSKMSIAFQTNNNNKMFTYYYLLFNLQVSSNKANIKSAMHKFHRDQGSDDRVWKNFLLSQNLSTVNVSSERYFKIWEKVILDPSSPWHRPTEDYSLDYDNN